MWRNNSPAARRIFTSRCGEVGEPKASRVGVHLPCSVLFSPARRLQPHPAVLRTSSSPRPGSVFAHGPYRRLSAAGPPRGRAVGRDARSGLRHAWPAPRPPKRLAISKNAARHGSRSREAGREIQASLSNYVARFPAPRRHMLPSTVPPAIPRFYGQHTASRFEGRTWGFITQPRTAARPTRRPPARMFGAHPFPRAGRGSINQAGSVWMQLRKDFLPRSSKRVEPWQKRKQPQSVVERTARQKKHPVANNDPN